MTESLPERNQTLMNNVANDVRQSIVNFITVYHSTEGCRYISFKETASDGVTEP